MQALWLALVLTADGGTVAAKAADAGTAPVAAPAVEADAGTVAWKAKPVVVFASDQATLEKYATLKPAERAKLKTIITTPKIGTRVEMGIFVEGYELPYSRRVDLSADVSITDVTGRSLLEKASFAGAQTMDPKTMLLVPLKPYASLMWGLTDREGEYQLKVTIWDHVRGTSTRLETKFNVTR